MTKCQFGDYKQAVCDVSAATGSVIRQFDNCDLTWRWLFDGSDPRPIPPPGELYRLFSEDAPVVLERFNLMLLACILHKVRVVPTLFTIDGGSKLNDDQTKKDAGNQHLKFEAADGTQISYRTLRAPARPRGVVIPTTSGWDPFYWDVAEVGLAPFDTEFSGEPERTATQKIRFEQFCLHILAHDTMITDPYMLECARRKSLALAAFGRAIGEHLAHWDAALAPIGLSIGDVVAYLELGNEMSVHWMDADSTTAFDEGARELGAFMGLLAGPAWKACPKLRFSIPGIASWGEPSRAVWTTRLDWIHDAVSMGLASETTFWAQIQQGRAMDSDDLTDAVDRLVWEEGHPEAASWLATATAAGFDSWPPPLDEGIVSASNLVHHANMHWFHSANMAGSDTLDPSAYATQSRLVDDISDLIDRIRIIRVGNLTLSLTWSVHPAGFPGAIPTNPRDGDCEDDGGDADSCWLQWSSFATPLFQAGMVTRLILTGLSQGAELVSWHTHMAGLAKPSGVAWNKFTSMGLRDDIVAEGSLQQFRASRDAYRRPSWYAFQRLSQLIDRSRSVRLLQNDNGLMVVRLESSRGFSMRSFDHGEFAGSTYRFAYVVWLDQTSVDPTRTLRFFDPAREGHARLSLAPEVATSGRASAVDACGYATGETIEWHWGKTGRHWSIEPGLLRAADEPGRWAYDWESVASIHASRAELEVVVHRASTERSPVPLCLLTNATPSPTDGRSSTSWSRWSSNA